MAKTISEKEYMLMVAQFAAAATTNNLIAYIEQLKRKKEGEPFLRYVSSDPIEQGDCMATKVLAKFGYNMPTDGNQEAQQFADNHE